MVDLSTLFLRFLLEGVVLLDTEETSYNMIEIKTESRKAELFSSFPVIQLN